MMTQDPPASLRLRVLPFLVLVLCLGFTFFSWFWIQRSWSRLLEPEFEKGTQQIELGAKQRLDFYLNLLYGVQGLFAANPAVTADQWSAYIQKQNIAKRYPALLDVRFIEKTPDGSFAAKFIAVSHTSRGKLEYSLGLDPFNRVAFEKAQDTGAVILTNRIDLTIASRKQAGFLIIFPIFKTEDGFGTIQDRRKSLVGFAVAVVRTNDLFRSVAEAFHIDYEIYDSRELTQDHLLYNDDRVLNAPNRSLISDDDRSFNLRSERFFSKDSPLKVPGHVWTLHFSTRSHFFLDKHRDQFLQIFLWAGCALSVIVFAAAFFLNESLLSSSRF